MKNKIKSTIIITAENQERFIERCIKSCLNQSVKNIEIIIVFTKLKNINILKKRYLSKNIVFLNIAKKINKPIVIHSRKAEAECLEILQQELPMNKIAVNLHCFSGKKKLVKKAVELGYYFSIPPNCVKAQQFQMIIELTPITQLLTETDSPWPSHNNERNEPSNVIESIKVIAKIKNISVEEASNHIWDNYLQFLGEK